MQKPSLQKITNVAFSSSVLLLVSLSASAELPAPAVSALGQVSTGITDAIAAAWPLIGAALVGGIIIKLVKRFAGKI